MLAVERDQLEQMKLRQRQLIGPDFLEHGAKRVGAVELRNVVESTEEILARVAEAEALGRYRENIEWMIGLVQDYWNGSYTQVPYWPVAVVVFTLQYVLKPVDIIPDSLPVIGQLDDALVVSHGLAMIRNDLDAYKIWKLAHKIDR